MSQLAEAKKAARAAAYPVREAAHAAGSGAARLAAAHALEEIAGLREVRVIAAYLPIRHEIDPRPAMLALHGLGFAICAPVIEGRGLPLRFRAWTPGCAVGEGSFGVTIPLDGDWVEPDVLLVPMVAFDARGFRLGYGGGFYDRTIEALRAVKPLTALGFAYAAQRVLELPIGPHDQPLDAVVSEAGVVRPRVQLAAAADRR